MSYSASLVRCSVCVSETGGRFFSVIESLLLSSEMLSRPLGSKSQAIAGHRRMHTHSNKHTLRHGGERGRDRERQNVRGRLREKRKVKRDRKRERERGSMAMFLHKSVCRRRGCMCFCASLLSAGLFSRHTQFSQGYSGH